jgi:hypothetical protein
MVDAAALREVFESAAVELLAPPHYRNTDSRYQASLTQALQKAQMDPAPSPKNGRGIVRLAPSP